MGEGMKHTDLYEQLLSSSGKQKSDPEADTKPVDTVSLELIQRLRKAMEESQGFRCRIDRLSGSVIQIAHQITEQLTSINGYASFMRDEKVYDHEYMGEIIRASSIISGIVGGLVKLINESNNSVEVSGDDSITYQSPFVDKYPPTPSGDD